jgi:uncharacterized protein (TIGR03083 family)
MPTLTTPQPVYTAHLLEPIHLELVSLLRTLTPEQWNWPTSAGTWRVRDVVAHLLDGDFRRLSYQRDGLAPGAGATAYPDLLAYLNDLNAQWIRATQRLSPAVLLALVEQFGHEAVSFLSQLPPHEPAFWPVAWAGEDRSENWMDVGRQYTEYWHHQQQIRDAVGASQLNDRRWLAPLLALAGRALPPALAGVARPTGTAVALVITGAVDARWSLVRSARAWELVEGDPPNGASALIRLDAEVAARVWFAGRRRQPVESLVITEGDRVLCDAVVGARALMV